MLEDAIVFGKCARCGTAGPAIELAGGYHSFLCWDCRNKFHSDCQLSQEWKSYSALEDHQIATGKLLESGKDVVYTFVENGKNLREAEIRLFKWSEKWVTGPHTADELKKIEANKSYWERRGDRS